MRNLEAHIRRMYGDIVRYGGAFGDGVEAGPYDPFLAVTQPDLTPFERAGVSVAVIHWLDSMTENSTWEAAVAELGPRVRQVLAVGLLDHELLVRRAAEAFLSTELEFVTALTPVYEHVVRKWMVAPPDARQ